MNQNSVGIRELKTNISRYLKQLCSGSTIVITDRGRPVARIVPIQTAVEDHVAELADAGLLAWNGRLLPAVKPSVRPRSETTVAELLLDDRE